MSQYKVLKIGVFAEENPRPEKKTKMPSRNYIYNICSQRMMYIVGRYDFDSKLIEPEHTPHPKISFTFHK